MSQSIVTPSDVFGVLGADRTSHAVKKQHTEATDFGKQAEAEPQSIPGTDGLAQAIAQAVQPLIKSQLDTGQIETLVDTAVTRACAGILATVAQLKITTSYGRLAFVNGVPAIYLYGEGYGKDRQLTGGANEAAIALVKAFGLPVEKRGDSNGKLICGAHHDDKMNSFSLTNGRNQDNSIYWAASFYAPMHYADEVAEAGLRSVKHWGWGMELVLVWSERYSTMAEALCWLEKWGSLFSPALRACGKQEQ